MKRQKKCRYCGQLFTPCSQNYRRQRACPEPNCQAQRAHAAVRGWHLKNPTYDDGREEYYRKWQRDHPGYWRARPAAYVKRNRDQQRHRDRKRRNLVKRNDWNWVHSEKISRIRHLGDLVKRNDSIVPVTRQTEEICRYLNWRWVACQTKR
jgi:hypothetical protein